MNKKNNKINKNMQVKIAIRKRGTNVFMELNEMENIFILNDEIEMAMLVRNLSKEYKKTLIRLMQI
jgi:hypothetical protein